jgi:steroid delta-isomerase-like uncharacterized protein
MKEAFTLLILIVLLPFGCGTTEKKTGSDLTGQQLVLRYLDSGWNAKDRPALQQILSEGFIRNVNGIQISRGSSELEAYIQNYQRAFPDLRISTDRILESEKELVLVWTFEGINTGEFGENLPTGKKAVVSGVSLFRLDADDKIEREDTYYNELYLLQQLGYTLNSPILD